MKVADSWLRHYYDQRIKFAKDLLLTVRLPLLSMSVLKKVLGRSYNTRNSTVFQSNEDCLDITKKILENREEFYRDRPMLNYKMRYCNQEKFSILVCGGYDELKEEYGEKTDYLIRKFDAENFDKFETFSELSGFNYFCSVNVMCELYVLAKRTNIDIITVYKYSHEKDDWDKMEVINTGRVCFSVCSFLNKIYVVGGHYKNEKAVNSCFEIDTASCKDKPIKRMNEARILAGCVAFQGKVVVSGGCDTDINNNFYNLNTVEAYCNVNNTWSAMPNMLHARHNHILVAIKSNLFVFGGVSDTCEIFDNISNKFSILKKPETLRFGDYRVQDAISIGGKVLVFLRRSSKVAVFDFDRDIWTEEKFEATKDIDLYVCVKLPKF